MQIIRLLRLDRPGSDGRVSIHLRICWQGNKVRLSTGEKVNPAHWDKSGKVKGGRNVKFATDINSRLDTYEHGLMKFAYQTENSGTVLTPAMVRAEIERIRQQELGQPVKASPAVSPAASQVVSLASFLEAYQQQRPGGLSKSTAQQISAIRLHLDGFMPGINWEHLRVNTLNQLKNYWAEEANLSDNSIASYFGSLRGALKYALSQSLPVHADYTLVSGTPAEVVRPALSWEHLTQLRATSWSEKHYPFVWLFLMACYTGLRFSDLVQARRSGVRLVDGYPCLMAIQQKSGTSVSVPLVAEAVSLIDEHPEGFPLPLSDFYNRQLKVIAKEAELNELVTVSSRYKGQLIHSVMPLHETIASHTARRTFASLMIEGGMNTKVLQQLMGHSTISSTEKYVKLPSKVVVGQTLEAWKKLSSGTPIVTPLWKKQA